MMNDFIKELKRRNVFKVGIAYAIVAWAILQFVDIVEGPMALPDWFARVTIVALAIGFPIALILSWAYEVTPEGVKKTREVEKSQSITPKTGQKINKLIMGALALALAFIAYDKLVAPGSGPGRTGDREASIAVLPFADMSPGGDQEYFADGISEEILNVLAKIPDLKVAGRTSSFKFKGQNPDFKLIGEELNVDHVLEGSVRKDGNRLRVTVQLISADDGFHIWSETYDRDAVDIFAIQDDISRAVSRVLQVKLGTGDKKLVEQETESAEAYALYLRARQFLHARGVKNLENAVKLFDAVTVLDPGFDEAYSGLARSLGLLINYRLTGEENVNEQQKAKDAALMAIEINPQNAEAYSALGYINMQLMEWTEADKNNLMATTLAPNDAEMANFAGDYYRYIGDFKNALKWEERALELDPLHVVNSWDMSFVYYEFGLYEEGLSFAEQALKLDPGFAFVYQVNVYNLAELGRFDEAGDMIAASEAKNQDPFMIQDMKTYLTLKEGKEPEFYENLEKLIDMVEAGQGAPSWIILYYLWAGDTEKGVEWFERAYREKDPLIVTFVQLLPEDFTSDPALIARFEVPGMKELFDIRRKHRENENGPKK